jgi:N-sulfoglucosamine sulfohydrolase
MMKFIYPVLFLLSVLIVSAQDNKPNIIWLVCEDQSAQFFPMYGDKTVSLPHLEKLAEDSVLFENMHATTPVCAPARSAIITGMYPTSLGTHNMRAYNEGRKTNQPQLGIPSYSPKFPDYIKPFTVYLREEGYYCTNSNKQDYNFKITSDAWDQSCRYCQGEEKENIHWRKRDGDQPFFAVFNFQITHESQIWKQQQQEVFLDPNDIEFIPPYFPDDPVIRRDIAINYSNLVRMDMEVGEIISELKEQGLYDEAYIFFYSDHGGPFPRHKRAIYQTGTKVPLFIKFPKSLHAGEKDDRLLSFVDLAPSVLQMAGIEIPKHIQGKPINEFSHKSLRDFLITASDRFDGQYDRIRAIQDKRYKLIRSFYPDLSHHLDVQYRKNMPMMQKLLSLNIDGQLNQDQQKWFGLKDEYEFYDLQKDPYEMKNQIQNPAYQDHIQLLKVELEKWMLNTNDLGAVPEQVLIKQSTSQ